MRPSRLSAAGAALAIAGLLMVPACGKKGPPLAPLRPVPARVTPVEARVADGQVTLRFTVPDRNADNTTPAAATRYEIYRVPVADVETATPAAAIVQPDQRVGSVAVEPAPASGSAPAATSGAAAAAAPLRPGDPAVFTDTLPAAAGEPPPAAWRYVVVGVAGRDRRGQPSEVVTVPAGPAPAAPGDVALDYDESTWQVTWTPAEGRVYDVYDVTAAAQAAGPPAQAPPPVRLSTAPVEGGRFTTPVVLGDRRCFAVQATERAGATAVASALSPPVCKEAVDRFPPPPPERLIATIDAGAVALTWTPVPSLDLAGYRLLRAAGAGQPFERLTDALVEGTSYADATVKAGVAYTYAVVAVDRSGNESPASVPQTIFVR